MTIAQDLKQPVLPNYIELFILDLTPLGGPLLRFTPNTAAGASSILFGGNTYQPLPVAGSGWETSIDGSPPQPTLKVSNVTKFLQAYLATYKDFVGARLTRYQTLDKYLDNGSSPDSTQTFNMCVYMVEQKTKQNKYEIEFKLSAIIDSPQLKLPRQQVLRTEFPGAGLFRK
jgi:lambda family phage minor tail protein L